MKNMCVYLFLFTFLFLSFPKSAPADSIFLSPPDFQEEHSDILCIRTHTHLELSPGSTNTTLYAPVHLPDGAQITSLVVWYTDTTDSGGVNITLYKVNAYSGGITQMANWNSTGAPGAYLMQKISPITGGNTVNNSGYAYIVRVGFTSNSAGPSLRLYKVKINYN